MLFLKIVEYQKHQNGEIGKHCTCHITITTKLQKNQPQETPAD